MRTEDAQLVQTPSALRGDPHQKQSGTVLDFHVLKAHHCAP